MELPAGRPGRNGEIDKLQATSAANRAKVDRILFVVVSR
jgi:hypothetical protein